MALLSKPVTAQNLSASLAAQGYDTGVLQATFSPAETVPTAASGPVAASAAAQDDAAFLAQINLARNARGLQPLALDPQLELAARYLVLSEIKQGRGGNVAFLADGTPVSPSATATAFQSPAPAVGIAIMGNAAMNDSTNWATVTAQWSGMSVAFKQILGGSFVNTAGLAVVDTGTYATKSLFGRTYTFPIYNWCILVAKETAAPVVTPPVVTPPVVTLPVVTPPVVTPPVVTLPVVTPPVVTPPVVTLPVVTPPVVTPPVVTPPVVTPPVVTPPTPTPTPAPAPTPAAPPTVTSATAIPSIVNGTTTALSAQATDPQGQALTYAWSGPSGVSFSNAAASSTTATFTHTGAYTLTVKATDTAGLSASENVLVSVNQALSSLSVTPGTTTLALGTTQLYQATGTDQFGSTFSVTPSWSVTGGAIDSGGNFTATTAGAITVTATSGGATGTAQITVSAPTLSLQQILDSAGYDADLLQATFSPAETVPTAASGPVAASAAAQDDAAFLAQINLARNARGLQPLALDPQLELAARYLVLSEIKQGRGGNVAFLADGTPVSPSATATAFQSPAPAVGIAIMGNAAMNDSTNWATVTAQWSGMSVAFKQILGGSFVNTAGLAVVDTGTYATKSLFGRTYTFPIYNWCILVAKE